MRVVSVEPDSQLTLIADQPTTMYITTRMTDAAIGRTRIARSFLWEQPDDADMAEMFRQSMQAIVVAGEQAIKSIFEEAPG